MLSMTTTGNMRILKKLDGGEDKNGQAWSHFAAISNEQVVGQDEKGETIRTSDFYIVKAFGSLAEYIDRNLNTPRRVQVSGRLEIEKYNRELAIKRDVTIGEDVYEIDFTTGVETARPVIYAYSCDFLDKKREKKEDEVVEETVVITKK